MDRSIRLLLGEIILLLAVFWTGGWLRIVLFVVAVIVLFTAISGFCGLYQLLGINTVGKRASNIFLGIVVVLFLAIAVLGSYYSIFFTKKFFLEDYNRMNNFYKQTLFYTGQDKRAEAVDNYANFIREYAVFVSKYEKYHPYVLWGDKKFNEDVKNTQTFVLSLKDKVNSGDLKAAHTDFETVRPVFQDILKRNNFSMLAVVLVDFHDAMETIIAKADAKDSAGLVAIYPGVDVKLKDVELVANDAEIQAIRANLDAVYNLAKEGKNNELSAKAGELKSSFVKVYLKRG